MEPAFAKVYEHPELIKDVRSKAILNVDVGAIARHQQMMAKINKDKALNTRVENIEQKLVEIQATNDQILGYLKTLAER